MYLHVVDSVPGKHCRGMTSPSEYLGVLIASCGFHSRIGHVSGFAHSPTTENLLATPVPFGRILLQSSRGTYIIVQCDSGDEYYCMSINFVPNVSRTSTPLCEPPVSEGMDPLRVGVRVSVRVLI